MCMTKAEISMMYERHDETVKYFKTLVNEEQCSSSSEDELNWLTNAYRIAQNKRDHIMEVENSTRQEDDYQKKHISSILYDARDELNAICVGVIDRINSNLLQNVEISTREKVFAYKIKGDFLRYMWEASSDANTCKRASEAYYEAMSMCQWNFKPTDVFLLQVAMNYTIHLINANDVEKALIVLEKTINNALKHQDDCDPTNKTLVEPLLEHLKANLVYFQRIANERKPVQSMDLEFDEYSPEIIDFDEEQMNSLPDDAV